MIAQSLVTTAPAPTSRAFGDAVLVVFLLAQLADGLFTYLGVASVGLVEGNPVLRFYMDHLGVGASLLAAKLVACGCAVLLHLLAFHRVLAVLTSIYLSAAVLPWAYLIFVVHA